MFEISYIGLAWAIIGLLMALLVIIGITGWSFVIGEYRSYGRKEWFFGIPSTIALLIPVVFLLTSLGVIAWVR